MPRRCDHVARLQAILESETLMPNLALPAMSPARIDALSTALSRSKVYLEFGMGGSTVLAARLGVPTVFSVDSSPEWVQHVTSQIGQLPSLTGKVKLLHADLGPIGEWGYPKGAEKISNWPSYYHGPWRTVHAAGLQPDLVLIDGRFRVACFLYSLTQLKAGATILWDDYTNRPEYHSVERYLEPVAHHDQMAVFEVTGQEDLPAVIDSLLSGLYVLD
jgi:hypothetical protein